MLIYRQIFSFGEFCWNKVAHFLDVNVYKFADIVCNLSKTPEPFGRTTIEAASVGTKIMGWDHGGTKEILNELFPHGLVKLGDIQSLKKIGIDYLLIPEKNDIENFSNPFDTPIIPLFNVFGSISNSGGAWHAAHPAPPFCGGAKNNCFPKFSWVV